MSGMRIGIDDMARGKPYIEQVEPGDDRIRELEGEVTDLRCENDDLREKLKQRDVDEAFEQKTEDMRPGAMMLTVAVLVVGRLAIFRVIESGWPVTDAINGVFAIAGAIVLWRWAVATWQTLGWGVVGKAAFVLASLACGTASMLRHPYLAGGLVVAAIVFAASPGWERLMAEVLVFIHHPVGEFRRLRKK